uniref:Methyltransferase domain-containing protein n=1 Tax=Noctiluca scintillans TaxID=2966 RepID=A0A7S1AKF1_NOCSC|mmetsp:Transcript_49940/g.132764  ORF Transcript_49940/g.132764 Transcript_49940/m.132764 type:complete len:317 (+) Transcript_49940:100-1050(+)
MPKKGKRIAAVKEEDWEKKADEVDCMVEPGWRRRGRGGDPRGVYGNVKERAPEVSTAILADLSRQTQEVRTVTPVTSLIDSGDHVDEQHVEPVCRGTDTEELCEVDRRVPRGADRALEAHEAFGHDSIREAYGELGAVGFYAAKGAQYVNPHDVTLREALVNALNVWRDEGLLGDDSGALHRVLDVACGSGEASLAFEAWAEQTGFEHAVDACDPYTYEAYARRSGRQAHRWSFEDVADGILDAEEPYDVLLCSFCLHLLDRSWLSLTLSAMARAARLLIVLTPHKRPTIDKRTGWDQLDEMVHHRVRVRLYRSHT